MFQQNNQRVQTSLETGLSSVVINLQEEDPNLTLRATPEFLNDIFVVDALITTFDAVIAEATALLRPEGEDHLGVVVEGVNQNDEPVHIGISFRPWLTLNGQTILDAIVNVLNSQNSLTLNFRFTFTRRVRNPIRVMGVFFWKGDLKNFVGNKHSIVSIHPPADPFKTRGDCFFQLLALGLAYLVNKDPSLGFVDLPFTDKTYSLLTKSRNKFKLRKEFADEIRTQIGSVDLQDHKAMEIVQEFYGVHLVLFSFNGNFIVHYPTQVPVQHVAPTIFGIISSSNGSYWDHVDFVNSPTSLLQKKLFKPRICYLKIMKNFEEKVLKSLQEVFKKKEIISSRLPEDFLEAFWFLLDNINVQEALAQAIWEQQNPSKVRKTKEPYYGNNDGIH